MSLTGTSMGIASAGADPLTATLTHWSRTRSASSARPPQALVR